MDTRNEHPDAGAPETTSGLFREPEGVAAQRAANEAERAEIGATIEAAFGADPRPDTAPSAASDDVAEGGLGGAHGVGGSHHLSSREEENGGSTPTTMGPTQLPRASGPVDAEAAFREALRPIEEEWAGARWPILGPNRALCRRRFDEDPQAFRAIVGDIGHVPGVRNPAGLLVYRLKKDGYWRQFRADLAEDREARWREHEAWAREEVAAAALGPDSEVGVLKGLEWRLKGAEEGNELLAARLQALVHVLFAERERAASEGTGA